MSTASRSLLSLLAATSLVLAGCGDSPGDETATSTAIESSTTEQPETAPAGGPSPADDRKDARQNVARIADDLKGLNTYVADFDEVAPVHAASGDAAATTQDAQTMIAALGLAQSILIFDSPAAADRELSGYRDAIRTAKKRLEAIGKGSDLVSDVERAKASLDAITTAADALSRKLESIAGE